MMHRFFAALDAPCAAGALSSLQHVMLLAADSACAGAVLEKLVEDLGVAVCIASIPTDPQRFDVDDGTEALLLAVSSGEEKIGGLVEALAAGNPRLPLVVLLPRAISEDAEADLIARGAADCLLLPAVDGASLARVLRRSMLRHRRLIETLRQAESTLEAVRLSLDKVHHPGRVGIWGWDILSDEFWFSGAARGLFGLPDDGQAIGYEQVMAAVHPADRSALEDALDHSLCNLTPFYVEHRVVGAGGRERMLCQQGEVGVDATGRPTRMIGTLSDITDSQQARQVLAAAHDELELKVKERTRVLMQEIAQRQRVEAALRTSEQRIRAITDALPGMVAYIDGERRFRFANRRHQEWLGIDPQQLEGLELWKALGESNYRAMAPQVDAVLAGHEVVYEGVLVLGDGQTRIYQATHLPHRGADGRVLGYFSLTLDITERRRTEEALRRSEEKYRALMNDAADAILLADSSGRLVEGNRRAEDLLAFPRPRLSDNWICDILADAHRGRGRGWFDELLRQGRAVLPDTLVKTRDGRAMPADMAATAVTVDGQRIYQVVVKDISDHRAAEQQLRSAKEAAELADRAKTEFLANMSHELRTPLNAIIGFSDIMRSELMGPIGIAAYRGYVEDIHASGRHLLEVINEILDMSKVESGTIELHPVPVDLSGLVRSCLRLIHERAEQGHLSLTTDIPERLPLLLVDERRFKQILLNLLSNAVKFTPPGGDVSVSARLARDGSLAVAVTDTGIGMGPEDQAKALAPFGQVDSSLSRRYDGTGLGLPLTKAFTELHDGVLELTSAPGLGTTVTVRLPAGRVVR